MNKLELRKFAINKRKTLNYDKEKFKNYILNNFDLSKCKLIAIYKPLKYEFDLTFLENKCNVCYPKTSDFDMEFYKNVTKFEKSSFGVLEPVDGQKVSKEEIDLMFVPSLVINARNFRIGHGKGYYDKFLANSNVKTISIVYKDLYLDFSEEYNDQKIGEVIIWER